MSDVGPLFYASYPGTCSCGNDFDEGDELRYVDGELLREECCGHEYSDEHAAESATGLDFHP